MPTAPQITVTQLDLTGARCPALFCSELQPSDAPDAATVATAKIIAVKTRPLDRPPALPVLLWLIVFLLYRGEATRRRR